MYHIKMIFYILYSKINICVHIVVVKFSNIYEIE